MGFFIADSEIDTKLLPYILKSDHQGVSIIDRDLNILLINHAACKMLDVPIEVIEQENRVEAVYRFKAERGDYGSGDLDLKVAERMDLTRQFLAHDIERERGDGHIIRIQGTPVEDIGFVTILTDVTEQRTYEAKLEAELEASIREVKDMRDLMLNAINAIDDGLLILDDQDRLALANARMQDLYPVLRHHLFENSHIDDIEDFELPSEDTGIEGYPLGRHSSEQKLHDDHWYRIEQSDTANGGRIAIYSDITTYKDQTHKLQEHTNQLVKLLQKEMALSETQREFVSMASHEFKTPLAIIDSNAQRIQRKIGSISPDRLEQRVDNIRESVKRMQYLINRFMDFSTDEIAGIKVDAKAQHFRAAIERLCRSHADMEEENNFSWDLEDLPGCAFFDHTLLDQCISNILSNAVKYSAPGSPVKVVGRRNDKYLMIDVMDQGVGIPRDELGKIFNKYYRASTSSGNAGTGIGLNFAQMVLKEHGGHIEVQSEVGKGSTFTIFLPAAIEVDQCDKLAS